MEHFACKDVFDAARGGDAFAVETLEQVFDYLGEALADACCVCDPERIILGGGDTAFSAKMHLVSMWCIIVPFSAMAAFWWKCPPVAVFFLLKWDQLYKAIPVGIRLHSWKWVKKVTRV